MRKRKEFTHFDSKNTIFWIINDIAFSCSAKSFRSKEQAEKDLSSVVNIRKWVPRSDHGISDNYNFPNFSLGIKYKATKMRDAITSNLDKPV